jgi:hypothetical protein
VIISPSDSEKLRLHSDSSAQLPPEEGGLGKTGSVLSENDEEKLKKAPEVKKAAYEPDEDESLDETVIMRPGGAEEKG